MCAVYRLFAVSIMCLAVTSGTAKAATFTIFGDFAAATSALTLEGFENSSIWTPTLDTPLPVASQGVTWSAANYLTTSENVRRTGLTAVFSGDAFAFEPQNELIDVIYASLPGGVFAVGGYVTTMLPADYTGPDTGASSVMLTAFNASNQAIAMVETSTLDEWMFLGLTTTQPIASLQFAATNSSLPDDDFLLDDFYFGALASPVLPNVPTPPAFFLLFSLFGLAGLHLFRRTKG